MAGGQQRIGHALAPELTLARGDDAIAHGARSLAAGAPLQVGGRDRGHLDLQVDAVEQGARDARAVARDGRGAATAAARVVAGITARARVHRGEELEPRREIRLARSARDGDAARLHRLPPPPPPTGGSISAPLRGEAPAAPP